MKLIHFDEKIMYPICSIKVHVCTVWKLRKFSLTLFWQKFRENNVFIDQNTKELI